MVSSRCYKGFFDAYSMMSVYDYFFCCRRSACDTNRLDPDVFTMSDRSSDRLQNCIMLILF